MSKKKTKKKRMKKAGGKNRHFPSFISNGKSIQISVTVDSILYQRIKHVTSETQSTHKDLFIKAMIHHFYRLGYEY